MSKKMFHLMLVFALVIPSTTIINGEEKILSKEETIRSNNSSSEFSLEEMSLSEQEGLILALLEPHVTEAMNHYYGRLKRFDLADISIVEIEKGNCAFCFDVTVELTVKHSDGEEAGVDEMTFAVNKGKVVPTHYEHKKGISQS